MLRVSGDKIQTNELQKASKSGSSNEDEAPDDQKTLHVKTRRKNNNRRSEIDEGTRISPRVEISSQPLLNHGGSS